MTPLEPAARRLVCRSGFVLLCVVPTLAVCLWCLNRRLPRHVAAHERDLADQIGALVDLDRVVHLRPGRMRLEGVTIADAETGHPMLRAAAVEVGWSDGALVLVTTDACLRRDALRSTQQVLSRMIRVDDTVGQRAVRLIASRVAIRDDWNFPDTGDDMHVEDVWATLEWQPSSARLSATLRPTTGPGEGRVRIKVVRDGRQYPAVTSVELHTGGAALPCRLLAPWLDVEAWAGGHSRLRGLVWVTMQPDAWEAEFTGQVEYVDLDRLVSRHVPHHLSGTADLRIERARFRDGRLEQANGTLVAGPGQIGRSLVEGATTWLKMPRAGRAVGGPALMPYQQLAAEFTIDAEGLRLTGRCPGQTSGVVLMDDAGPLVGQPQGEQSIAALLHALSGSNDPYSTETRQVAWLARVLPLEGPGPH